MHPHKINQLQKKLQSCIRKYWMRKDCPFVVNDITFQRTSDKAKPGEQPGESLQSIVVEVSSKVDRKAIHHLHIPFMEMTESAGDEHQTKWKKVLAKWEKNAIKALRLRGNLRAAGYGEWDAPAA